MASVHTISDNELERIIQTAIETNPISTFDSIEDALQKMKLKGFRPITPFELRQTMATEQVIRLWRPINGHPEIQFKHEKKNFAWCTTNAGILSSETC